MPSRSGSGSLARVSNKSQKSIVSFKELGERLPASAPFSRHTTGSVIKTIECELLPRLMIAFQSSGSIDRCDYLTPVDRAEFLRCLVTEDMAPSVDFIRSIGQRDVPMELIFSDLMANAAVELGVMWEEDLCDFTDVTLAMCRIQELLRMNSVVGSPLFGRDDGRAHRIMVTTARDEQHTLGALITSEIFRRDGWFVTSEPGTQMADLIRIVSRDHYDFIGISASSDRCLTNLRADVASLRASSMNREVKLLVGGPLFDRHTRFAQEIDAAFVANEAMGAPAVCRRLLAQSSVAC